MEPNATSESLTFRYLPGFLPLTIAVGIFFFHFLFSISRDLIKYGGLLSPKGLLLVLLAIFGNIGMWSVILKLWQLHWRFIFTPTHLIAAHWLRRQRVQIPWASIVRVRKLPRPWWARGGGGLGISQIETAEGQQIPFMTHMMVGYKKFLEDLKARAVNCRSFEPYYSQYEDCPRDRGRR